MIKPDFDCLLLFTKESLVLSFIIHKKPSQTQTPFKAFRQTIIKIIFKKLHIRKLTFKNFQYYYKFLLIQYSSLAFFADLKNQANACLVWRRFANLFETSQSLFWASFGLISLSDFELTGIKEFTRFWALLMFGSYSVCNIIVLLNMLIAMMSNSFQIISEKADTEWKFARTKLWVCMTLFQFFFPSNIINFETYPLYGIFGKKNG